MARISLNCSCGWNFFIPGSTPGHEVNCPSCAQTVRIPGRKPGKDGAPMTAGDIAYEVQRKQSLVKMIVGGVVVAVIALIVIIVMSMGSKPPDEVEISNKRDPGLPGLGGTGSTGTGRKPPASFTNLELPPPPPPPPPLYTGPQVEELKRGVFANVWLTNMTGLVSECMRYRNLTNEWAQLQADMAAYDGKIKNNLKELAKVGEKVPLETYLSPGDQILGFANRDFTRMKPGEAAAFIQEWVSKWRAGPVLEQLNFVRNEKKMTIYLEFPEETRELLSLVRHPALGLDGNPGTGLITEMVAVPADVIKDINGKFDGLPAGYRSFLMATERNRFEDLMKNKKGTSDDVEWLKSRILNEAIPSFQREADTIRAKILELEPKLKENVASDVIYRKNGTKFEGQIIQQTDTFVKVKNQFGAVTIPAEDVLKVEKGKGAALDFPAKWTEASKPGAPAERVERMAPLLAWCIEKNLKTHKEFVAFNILTLDASHENARRASGLPRPLISAGSLLPSTPKYPVTDGARIESLDRTIELIANDVVARTPLFPDLVTEMRRRTETLTSATAPFAPEKSAKGVNLIRNPLTFRPNEMTVSVAMEIGTWWSQMSTEDRRQFAKYFGLWCAYTRTQKR
jgi:hypothetical protein